MPLEPIIEHGAPQPGGWLEHDWLASPDLTMEFLGGEQFRPFRFQRFMADIIINAYHSGWGRVIITIPPRHGKSEFDSRWLPIWALCNDQTTRVILASYEAGYAAEWGRKTRNTIEQNDNCPITLASDSQAANRWNTPYGGGMVCAGVGGPITGRGGDLIVIDDPIKNVQDAYSPLKRRRLREWFDSVLYTRCEPGGMIVLVMTRWHPDDLAGYLIADHEDNWTLINLPALAEAGDPLGRAEGDPLCPERYTTETLGMIRRAVGQTVWDAQYMGRPTGMSAGRTYDRFTDEHIDGTLKPRPILPLHLSIDFNRNPGMHGLIGQYDPKADLFVALHELHGPRMTIEQMIKAFEEWVDEQPAVNGRVGFNWPELHVFGDASGRSEWEGTGESSWALVRRLLRKPRWEGVNVRFRVPKANPARVDRIESFQDAIRDTDGVIHYRVHPQCKRLVDDMRRLQRGPDGMPDKSDTELSHASEAEGYRVVRLRPLRTRFEIPTARVGFGD